MVHFSKFYNFKNFMKMYSLIYLNENKLIDQNYINENKKCRFEITIAAINFIRENIRLNNINPLKVINHKTFSINLWNKIISFENFVPNENECRNSFGALIFSFYETEFKDNPDLFYNTLCNKITIGNIGDWDFNSMEKCLNCSKQVSIKFDYWNPNLDLLNEEEDKNTNCLEFLNKNIEFKFNTSELLIYDWFRIEGLDEIIESEKYLDGTEIGNILEVEYLLKEFNFISVYVGEHDHKILLSEEYLFCGSTNKYNQKTFKLNNETKLTNIGYIGTNWKVTIIEKEQLINILMKKYSKKEAIKLVEDYIKSNLVSKINVAPGNYKLHFNSSPENFRKFSKPKISNFKTTFYIEKLIDK